MKKKNTVKKHHALIQSKSPNLTLVQRKTFNYFLAIAQIEGDKDYYKSKLSDIQKICNVASDNQAPLKKSIKGLMNQIVEFDYTDPKHGDAWRACVLISDVDIKFKTGEVTFQIPKGLRDRILFPDRFAYLDLPIIAGFKSKYALPLWEFLKKFVDRDFPVERLEISEFRFMMGLDEKKYPKFMNLNQKVIQPAVSEVNDVSELFCTCTPESGLRPNRVEYLKFTVERKKKFTAPSKDIEQFDLFQDVLQIGNLKPVEIKNLIPMPYQNEKTWKIINAWKNPSPEWPVEEVLKSNIMMTREKSKKDFYGYLCQALRNDWAKDDRVIKRQQQEKEFKRQAIESAKQNAEIEKTAKEDLKEIFSSKKIDQALIVQAVEAFKDWKRSDPNDKIYLQVKDITPVWESRKKYLELKLTTRK